MEQHGPGFYTESTTVDNHTIDKHIDSDTAGALQITENDHKLLHDLGLDWNPGDPNEYWKRHE